MAMRDTLFCVELPWQESTQPPRRVLADVRERGGGHHRDQGGATGGDRTKAAHPATPVSVEELARHAAFLAAGARARSTSLRCEVA